MEAVLVFAAPIYYSYLKASSLSTGSFNYATHRLDLARIAFEELRSGIQAKYWDKQPRCAEK